MHSVYYYTVHRGNKPASVETLTTVKGCFSQTPYSLP